MDQKNPPRLRNSAQIVPLNAINPGLNWNFVKKLGKVKKFIDKIKTSSVT